MFAFCIRLNNSVLVRGESDPPFQDSVTEIGGSSASGGGVLVGDNVMDCGAGANDSENWISEDEVDELPNRNSEDGVCVNDIGDGDGDDAAPADSGPIRN